jgi:porin
MNRQAYRGRSLLQRLVAVGALCLAAVAPVRADDSSCASDDACRPVELALAYSADWRHNASGGVAVGSAYSGLLEAGVSVSPVTLRNGIQFAANASLMYSSGRGVSERFIGDLHGVNNIEAPTGWRAYEVWTEFRFGARRTSLRAGLLDLNAEFDAPATSAHFVGPAHGIGTEFAQTGLNGPSIWPVTGLGVRVAHSGESWTARFGAFDAVPGSLERDRFAHIELSGDEGALLAGEVEWQRAGFNKLALGVWSYTAEFDRVASLIASAPVAARGNRGAYALVDARLGSAGHASLNGFFRVGYADPRFNAIRSYVGVGVVANNIRAARPDDAVGLAFSYGALGEDYRALLEATEGTSRSAEINAELTYRFALGEQFAVLPSLQWIQDPGATGALADAWVFGVRVEMSVSKAMPWLARAASRDRETLVGNRE